MKFKLFVSGNQTELREERLAVQDAILNSPILRDFFTPFLFENLPASGRDPVFTYLDEVRNSDIYLGILGKKYGNKDENGISATENEYNTFIEHVNDGEVLVLIKGENNISRDSEVNEFLEKTGNKTVYRRFNSIDELKEEVIKSLQSFLENEGIINIEPFDKRINSEAGYNAIDENEVIDFLQKRANNLDVEVPDVSIKDILLNLLKVLKTFKGEFHPTNTGILFFSREASNYIPQNVIKMARFKGITRTNIIDSKEIKGPIYRMIDDVEIFFKRNTRIANKIVDFKRVDIPEYPYPAIREALINAIAHRDYNRTGAQIMFSIYDDRVEISSPGSLVSGLSINDLENKHETRNEAICDIFKLTKDMETFGTGIGKMKDFMKAHGLKEPEFMLEGDFFVVKFYGPGDKILDLVSDIPDERMTDLKEIGLNERQIKALELMVNDGKVFTNKIYQETFNVSRNTASRDLNGLIEKRQVTVKGKARARTYRAF